MNIRSTGISDDSSCASLQGCTAACVGLKMTEEQWLQSFVFGQKQTNNKKKRNIKSIVHWYFHRAWQESFRAVFLWIVQLSHCLDSPKP